MKFDDDDRHIIFSTGHRVYCFGNVIGLMPKTVGEAEVYKRISYGWDGDIPTVYDASWMENPDEAAITPDECLELADFMIAQWKEYRAQLEKTKP